jgi:hypothetical protein
MTRLIGLLYGLVGTVLAGIGIVAVVSVPAMADRGMTLIPAAAIVALVLALPISWGIARAIEKSTSRPA